MDKLVAAAALALGVLLTGCDSSRSQQQLAQNEATLRQTADTTNQKLDSQIRDAQMKNRQLKRGDKAACRWLKKQPRPPSGGWNQDNYDQWMVACKALN